MSLQKLKKKEVKKYLQQSKPWKFVNIHAIKEFDIGCTIKAW